MSDKHPVYATRSFMLKMFVIGSIFGIVSATTYALYVSKNGRWDASTSSFQTLVLFWGLAFLFPCLTISLRIMYQSLVMGQEGLEAYRDLRGSINDMKAQIEPIVKKVDVVVDKIIPMTQNLQVVVDHATKMGEDVVSIAHKTRGVLEQMNGTLDVKVIGDKLDRLGDSLTTIAKALGGEVTPGTPVMEEFDPMKAVAGRRRRA